MAFPHQAGGNHPAVPLTDQLILAAARQLAIKGDFRGASTVLDLGLSAEALESGKLLRAKMAAQQGRFEDAIGTWRLVLSDNPNQGEAAAGIARAEELAKRQASKGLRWKRGQVLFGALAVIGLLMAIVTSTRMAERLPDRSPPAGDRSAHIDSQAGWVQAPLQPDKSIVAMPGVPSAEDALRPLLMRDLRVPGVSVHERGGDLVLVFERGLFGAGQARIHADSRSILRPLAKALGEPDRRIQIEVSGLTDPTPPRPADYRDNQSLALARAAAVIDFLLAAGVPASRLTLLAAMDGPAPFSNDTAEGRARNRSVMIRITSQRD